MPIQMGERVYSDPNYYQPEAQLPDEDRSFTGDALRTIGAGALGIGSGLASGGRYLSDLAGADNLSKAFQSFGDAFSGAQQGLTDDMSPQDRAGLVAPIMSPTWYENPWRNSALKVLGITPMIAATMVGAAIAPELAAVSAAVGNGAISFGQAADDVYKQVQAKSDDDLKEQVPAYNALRSSGVSEADAREQLSMSLMKAKPLVNGLIGVGAGYFGPLGKLAGAVGTGERVGLGELLKGAGEETGRGLGGRIIYGGTEGALANVAMGLGQDVSQQSTAIDLGDQKGYDYGQLGKSAVDAAIMGAGLGATIHGFLGARPGAVTDTGKDALDTDTTTQAPPPPPPGGTGGSTEASRPPGKTSGTVVNIPTAGPTLDQQAALDALKPPSATTTVPPPGGEIKPGPTTPPPRPTPDPTLVQQPDVQPTGQAGPTPTPPPAGTATSEIRTGGPRPFPGFDAQGNVLPDADQTAAATTTPAPTPTTPPATFRPEELPPGYTIHRPKTETDPGNPHPKLPKNIVVSDPTGKPIANVGPKAGPEKIQGLVEAAKEHAAKPPPPPPPQTFKEWQAEQANKPPVTPVGDPVPETAATIEAQLEQLKDPNHPRKAVMITPGTPMPKKPEGMSIFREGKDVFIYNSKKVKQPDLRAAYRANEHGKFLGLSPITKEDAMRSEAAGNPATVVTTRAADGTPVSDEAGTTATVQGQIAHAVDNARPGETVEQRTPDDVEAERIRQTDQERAQAAALQQEQDANAVASTAGVHPDLVQLRTGEPQPDVQFKVEGTKVTEEGKPPPEEPKPKTTGKKEAKPAETEKVKEGYDLPSMKSELVGQPGLDDAKRIAVDVRNGDMSRDDGARQLVQMYRDGKIKSSTVHTQVGRFPAVRGKGYSKLKLRQLFEGTKAAAELKAARPPDTRPTHEGEAKQQEKAARRTAADKFLDDTLAEEKENPPPAPKKDQSPADFIKSVTERAKRIYDDWVSTGLKLPTNASKNMSRGQMWLMEMRDLVGQKRPSLDRIVQFVSRQHQLEHGTEEDLEQVRREREVEASAATRQSGNVEEVEDKSGKGESDYRSRMVKKVSDDAAIEEKRREQDIPEGKQPDEGKGPVVNVENYTGGAAKIHVLSSHTGADFIDRVLGNVPRGPGGKIVETIRNLIAKRLRPLIKDLPVHIVSQEQMDFLNPKYGPGEVPGYYDPINHMVFLSEGWAQDDHTVIHELVHAAFERAVSADKQLYAIVEKMRQHLEDTATAGEKYSMYGLTDVREFISEAFSNPEFQDYLARKPLPQDIADELNLHLGPKYQPTLWDGIRQFVKLHVLKLNNTLGLRGDSVLDGIMRVGAGLEESEKIYNDAGVKRRDVFEAFRRPEIEASFRSNLRRNNPELDVEHPERAVKSYKLAADDLMDRAKNIAAELPDRVTPGSNARKGLMGVLTNDNIRQTWERLFPKGILREAIESQERYTKAVEAIKKAWDNYILRPMIAARAKHNIDFPKMAQLAYESRLYNVDPSKTLAENTWLTGAGGMQGRGRYNELRQRYGNLHPDLKKVFNDTLAKFKSDHADYTRALIDSYFTGGKFDPKTNVEGIKTRLLAGALTEDDKRIMEDAFPKGVGKAIMRSPIFREGEGPYVPFSRYGDFHIKAEHDIPTPEGAKRMKGANEDPNGNVYQFDQGPHVNEQTVQNFLNSLDVHAKVREIYLDADSGKRLKRSEGEALEKAGKPVDKRWRVTPQTKHVEFFETERDAREGRQALIDAKKFKNISEVRRRTDVGNLGQELSSPQLKVLLNAIDKNGKLTAEGKKDARRSLEEAAIGMQRGNRAMKRQIAARMISGSSTDLVRNTEAYAQASARAQARAKVGPEVDAAMDAMRQHEKVTNDEHTTARSDVMHEMEQRLHDTYTPERPTAYSKVMNRVMTYSYIKRMMSPAHLVIHSSHPWMISAPVLAARHGILKSMKALKDAYGKMGAGKAALAGLKSFGDMARDPTGKPVNWIDYFANNLAKVPGGERYAAMLKALADKNVIHPESGLEISRMDPGKSPVGRFMDRVDGAFQAITQAGEAINRVAEAIAAYDLEYRKNAGKHDLTTPEGRAALHKDAVTYAGDTLANTQGLYSRSNAARLFRNPTLRPFLQFKQFPQMMYHLLGRQIYDVFRKQQPGESDQEFMQTKKQAALTFGYLIATHAAMAGALGLPTEPIKAGFILANALGLTKTTWDDVEREAMKKAANAFGPWGGELLMHGISRGILGVDAHHRLGMSSLLTFGQPDVDKVGDTKRWLFEALGGAPVSLATDTWDGVSSILKGDFVKGAEKLAPAKAFEDIIKAVDMAARGKKTSRGEPGMQPYGIPATAARLFGFTPSSEAEYNEARAAGYAAIRGQKTDVTDLLDNWVNANAANKEAARQKILDYNRGKPLAQQITPKMMTRAVQDRKEADLPGKRILGFKTNKRNVGVLEDVARVYGQE